MPSAAQSMATIEQFVVAVGQVKAADGSTPLSEAGSIGGETEHPVKKVDDRLEKAKEGFRSSENTKDVKEDQGKPSVENAAEAKAGADKLAANIFNLAAKMANGQVKTACDKCGKNPCQCGVKKADGTVSQGGSAEDDHMQIGTKVAPTGEDPSTETSSAKAGKEDKKQGDMGGTSHPASTENNKIDGHKWAADMPLEKLASAMQEVGNNLCAQIAWVSQQNGNVKTAQAAQANAGGVKPTSPQQVKKAEVDAYLAQQIGWEMAGLVNGTFDKQAADSLVVGTLEEIIKTASDDADRFISFMHGFMKTAEPGAMPPGAGGEPPPMPPGAGGGGPPPGAGGGGDEAGMMAALGGGADAGGGGPPPEGGEGGGGPPGGGGGGPDAEAMQLAQILESLGVTPEQLEQAMQEEGGMGGAGGGGPPGGGMPPGGGGPPPGAGGGAPPGMEAAASDRGHRQSNEKMAAAAQYISELVQRSRARTKK